MTDTRPATDPTREEQVEAVAEAFRKAAVNGRLPAHREPLLFLSLAKIAVNTIRGKDYLAHFVEGPLDGQVLPLKGPAEAYRVTRPRAMARLTGGSDLNDRALEYGEYKRDRVTRDTDEMNLALYTWMGWT